MLACRMSDVPSQGGQCLFNATGDSGGHFLLSIMRQNCPLSCGFCACVDNDARAESTFGHACAQLAAAGNCTASLAEPQLVAQRVQMLCPVSCLQCVNITHTTSTTPSPSWRHAAGPPHSRPAAHTSTPGSSTLAAVVAVLGGVVVLISIAFIAVLRLRARAERRRDPKSLVPLLTARCMRAHAGRAGALIERSRRTAR